MDGMISVVTPLQGMHVMSPRGSLPVAKTRPNPRQLGKTRPSGPGPPMPRTPVPRCTDCKLPHCPKANSPKAVTESPIHTEVKLRQFLNACWAIEVTESEMRTDVKGMLLQAGNRLMVMVVAESGMTTCPGEVADCALALCTSTISTHVIHS
jgi:hypothetical protein